MPTGEIRDPLLPFARFRVYPDKKRRCYFKVIVFSSKRQMWAFYRQGVRGFPGNGQLDFYAITLPYSCIVGSKDSKREIGTILFHRQQTGTGTVSHEMTHAAVHYLRLKKANLNAQKSEEPLAHVVGELTRQFFRRY